MELPESFGQRELLAAESAANPRPGLLLVVFTVLSLVGYLALAVYGCVGLFGNFRWTSQLGSCICLAFGGYFTWQHYLAVFREVLGAAKHVRGWYFSFVWIFAVVLAALLISVGFGSRANLIPALTVVSLLLLHVTFTWVLFNHWARTLGIAQAGDTTRERPRFSLRELLVAIALLASVLGVSASILRQHPVRLAQRILAADCPFYLPATARDVSFCYSREGRLAYEFSINEAGAAAWADNLNISHTTPIDGDFQMPRFGKLHPTMSRDQEATITSGWSSTKVINSANVVIAYDREKERAYYFTESR